MASVESSAAGHREGAVAIENARSSRASQALRRCNAIREKRQPAVPGSDARNAVATICAIYEAAKTGKTVQVK